MRKFLSLSPQQLRLIESALLDYVIEHETIAAQPNAGWLEIHSFPIDAYTHRPLVLESGRAVAPDEPGIGVRFDWDRLAPFLSP